MLFCINAKSVQCFSLANTHTHTLEHIPYNYLLCAITANLQKCHGKSCSTFFPSFLVCECLLVMLLVGLKCISLLCMAFDNANFFIDFSVLFLPVRSFVFSLFLYVFFSSSFWFLHAHSRIYTCIRRCGWVALLVHVLCTNENSVGVNCTSFVVYVSLHLCRDWCKRVLKHARFCCSTR